MTMSSQQQQQPHQAQDYDTRTNAVQHIQNSTQPSQYYSAQPHYARPHTAQRSPQVGHGHSAYSATNHPKHTYRQYEDPIQSVLNFHPHTGGEGTTFTAYVQSTSDLVTSSRNYVFIFGSYRCPATLKSDDKSGNIYILTSTVPSSTLTGWIAPQVTVYLATEENGSEVSTVEVGGFTYTDAQPAYSPATNTPRKRKMSEEPESNRASAKRPGSQPAIRPKGGEDYGIYGYQPGAVGGVGYATYDSNHTEGSYILSPHGQADIPSQSQYPPPQAAPRVFDYPGYPAATDAHAQSIVAQQHLPHWTYPTPGGAAGSGGGGTSVSTNVAAQPASSNTSKPQNSLPSPQEANPPLVRTSTLQTHQTSGSGPGSFNPYGIYPHTSKAVLNIEGDLDTIASSSWTTEELENRRKLVQFWRTQKGATINTNFATVAANDRQTNTICISCIFWAEKGECYVTSVDCIYLLESLISVRFTVEEKNRIRRNLEGFRPMTVSKAKADSENFFKLIMAFPNPKPRNIEKDVKVFPWKILSMALKKIIGKYSASYSSTAAVLPQAPNPTPYPSNHGNEPPASSADALASITPTSASERDSATSIPPSSSLTSTSDPAAIKIEKPSSRHKLAADMQASLVGHPTIVNPSPQMWPQPHRPSPQHSKSHWGGMMGFGDSNTDQSSGQNTQSIHYRSPYSGDKRDGGSGVGQHISNNAP
ncbi:hypothetical protein DFH27DRAFT_269578 [Peziza echinospora]|nr:hypothetical protein DFH27DRAFT_269578 [Peziza echinospora]